MCSLAGCLGIYVGCDGVRRSMLAVIVHRDLLREAVYMYVDLRRRGSTWAGRVCTDLRRK